MVNKEIWTSFGSTLAAHLIEMSILKKCMPINKIYSTLEGFTPTLMAK